MINPLPLLRGETLGKTIYNVAAACALVVILGLVVYNVVAGKVWKWRYERADARAETAEARAETAETNARNADGALDNAATSRAIMDRDTEANRSATETAARRAETYGNASTATRDDGRLPVDLVRELDDAEARADAAARRLRGEGSR